MRDYSLFIAGTYLLALLVVAINVWLPWRRSRRLWRAHRSGAAS